MTFVLNFSSMEQVERIICLFQKHDGKGSRMRPNGSFCAVCHIKLIATLLASRFA